MLRDKISFIGIGQCGSNIVAEVEKKNFTCGIINTSQEDLDNDEFKMITNKLLIGKDNGAGKDRDLAKSNVKEFYKDIIEFVKDKIIVNNKTDLVYVCFSSGGGTGSGFGPIVIDVLKKFFPYIKFAAIIVSPQLNESPIALYNSRKCFEEIYNLDIPIMLADNDNFSDKGYSRKKLYNKVNEEIIDRLLMFIDERKDTTGIANMDEKDKMKLLTTPGIMVISTVKISKNISTESISNAINESWMNSIYVNLDFDKQIAKAGYIFVLKEEDTKFIDYDTINKNIGEPLEIFEGIYLNKEDNTCSITTILTGLSFPENKVNKLDELLSNVNDNKNSIKASKSSLAMSNNMNLFDNTKEKEPEIDLNMNLEDLFGKY